MSDINDNRRDNWTSEQYASTGWACLNRHAVCWVDTHKGYKRSAEVWGFSGPNDAPTAYYVHYTDVERPKFMVVINNVSYPEGYNEYVDAQDVTFD